MNSKPPEDYDEAEAKRQYEELDEKTLLIQQVSYLDAILRELHAMNEAMGVRGESERERERDHDTNRSKGGQWYRCTSCGSKLPEDELESHASNKHNAPPGEKAMHLYETI